MEVPWDAFYCICGIFWECVIPIGPPFIAKPEASWLHQFRVGTRGGALVLRSRDVKRSSRKCASSRVLCVQHSQKCFVRYRSELFPNDYLLWEEAPNSLHWKFRKRKMLCSSPDSPLYLVQWPSKTLKIYVWRGIIKSFNKRREMMLRFHPVSANNCNFFTLLSYFCLQIWTKKNPALASWVKTRVLLLLLQRCRFQALDVMSGDKVASTRKRVSQTLQLRNRVAISIRELERESRLPAPYKTVEKKNGIGETSQLLRNGTVFEERAHAFTKYFFTICVPREGDHYCFWILFCAFENAS